MMTASRLALTANHDTAIVNVAHVRHDQIVGLKAALNQNAFALGGALAEMRDHELYRALGFPTFEDYLVSNEVKLNRATAYRFMRIYQSFRSTQEQAQQLGWDKLDILARIIRDDDPPERILPLLEQAATMPREQLRAGVAAGKQQRIIVTPTVDIKPVPPVSNVVHELHDNNEATYPTSDAPEWQSAPPIEAIYSVAEEDDPLPPTPTPLRPLPLPTSVSMDNRVIGGPDVMRQALLTNWSHVDKVVGDYLPRVDAGDLRRNLSGARLSNTEATIEAWREWIADWDAASQPGLRSIGGR